MKKTTHVHLALWGVELAMPMITHMGTNYYRHAVKLEEHQHDGFELVFVLKGKQTYESRNEKTIEVQGGQFSFMPPGIIHKGKGGYETPCQFCWMIFNPIAENATTGTPFSKRELLEINRKYSSFDTMVVDFNTNMRNTLHRFRMAYYDHYGPDGLALSLPLLRSLASELILDSLRHLELAKEAAETNGKSALVVYGQAAVDWLEARIFDSITVEELADHLGFSPSRTFEIFKQHTGQSPIDYQLRLRIKEAQKQLEENNINITKIAHDCGFSSSQYFARIFRRHVGKSPSEFRNGTKKSK